MQTQDAEGFDLASHGLPMAPLAMPKQVLERGNHGLLTGLLARIAARQARTEG